MGVAVFASTEYIEANDAAGTPQMLTTPPPWLELPAPMPGATGWFFLVFMLVLVPWMAFRTTRAFQDGNFPPRMRVMQSTLLQQAFFGGFAWWTSRLETLDALPIAMPGWNALAAAAGFVVVAVFAMRPVWRRAVQLRQRRTLLLMPQGPKERAMWVAVSVAAGISEEVVWRGVIWALLARVTGDVVIAAAICVAVFALAHALQGWRAMLLIAAFSAVFHVMVWVAGTLAGVMLAHAVYDVIAGFSYARLARESGWDVKGESA